MSLAFHIGGNLASGNIAEAKASVEEGLALAEELEDKYVLGSILTAASYIEAYVNRDFAKADALGEEAGELLKENGSHWSYGIATYGYANILRMEKQFDKARGN